MAEERLGASFSIDVTQLKAGLAQANRLIKESESEFKAASAGMDDFTKSQEGLEARIKSLNKIQEVQEEKVKALQKQYDNLIEDGIDPTSAQMVKLRTDINNATAAVEKTKKETKKYENVLDDLGEEAEDLAEAEQKVEKSSGALDVAIGNLAANLVSGLGNAIKDAVSNLMNLSAETQEYREDIGKLKTAFESAGKSTELATKVYKEFYSVLGEEDRSVEAVNHLAKFVDTEEDMVKWTNIATGVWGTFGDSLPIEGLTEASNETAKVGKLTGVLTDALNWAGVNEEKFQESLDKCSSEQERQALITETLSGLYDEAAVHYRENNESVIAARKATSEYTDIMAELGEQMEPVNTAITEMKTQFVKEFAPAIKKDVIPVIDDFMGELEADGTIKKFSKNVSNITKKVLPPLSKAVKFGAENLETLTSVTFGAVTAYKAFSAAMKVSTAINAAKTAVAGLSAGVKTATVVQTGWNAAMAANPIGAVVTAIGLLVGGIALLVSSEKNAIKETDYLNASQRRAVEAAQEVTAAYKETKKAADEMANANVAQIDYTKTLWAELKTLADENGRVKDTDKARAEFILNELNNALGTEYGLNGNIIQSYKDMKKSIEDVILTKKAQILLEAYEESYAEAIKTVSKAEQDRALAAQELVLAEEDLQKKKEKLRQAALENENEWDARARQVNSQRISRLKKEVEDTEKILSNKNTAYKKADETVKLTYQNIDGYEAASTLMLAGETEKAVAQLERLGGGFKTAAAVAGESKDKQLEILKQQVIDTEVNLGILEAEYAKSQGNMTDEEKKQAQKRINAAKLEAKNAKDEYYKVGGNMVEGMARGAEDGEWHLTGSLKKTVKKALEAAKKFLGIASPSRVFKKQVGLMIPLGIAGGVEDGTGAIVKSIKKQSDEMQKAYDLPTVSARVENGISSKSNGASQTNNNVKSVNVYQTNNYSQSHSRYELYKVKQQTTAALNLALQGV